MKFINKLNFLENINIIVRESYKTRTTDLNNCEEKEIKLNYFTKFNLVVFFIACFFSIMVYNIQDALVNAILTYTTIYATLIIPVLIIIYDKFSNDPNKHLTEVEKKSDGAKERICLFKNFTKRFIFVTLESILISIFLILMILIYKAFPSYSLNFNYLELDLNFNKKDFAYFFSSIFHILIIKTIFAFFLVKLIYYNFYIIGALGDFFKSVFE